MMPLARTTDPTTSKDATQSQTKERRALTKLAIMDALWELGQATDEEIEDQVWISWPVSKCSPSGLRTRRKEMEREGLVRKARYPNGMYMYRHTRSGCEAQVWELTPNEGDE